MHTAENVLIYNGFPNKISRNVRGQGQNTSVPLHFVLLCKVYHTHFSIVVTQKVDRFYSKSLLNLVAMCIFKHQSGLEKISLKTLHISDGKKMAVFAFKTFGSFPPTTILPHTVGNIDEK